MDKQCYFLGANSSRGFYSCYHHFCVPDEGNFLWVIKGGPGCGKSSFMKKIGSAAEMAGYTVEYVLCSGDPDSLDGVYIKELSLGYVDGTAPHVQEVPYPAVRGSYLDLGAFYNKGALVEKADDIIKVNRAYKESYHKAYDLLRAFGGSAKTEPLSERTTRFESAISCHGIVTLDILNGTQSIESEVLTAMVEKNNTAVCYLHPLWPQLLRGAEINGTVYTTNLEIPPCEEAVSHLKAAKALHDELEGIYNPHVDFDGVYDLADTHIKKII